MSPPCPPDDLLRRLVDGDLDAGEDAELERHVESCPDCIARLESRGRRLSVSGASGWARPPGGAFPRLPGLAIEGVLGRGGMGVVYRARQEDVGRTVAVKVIPGADARTRRRWRNEVESAASVDHPNVVRVHAAGEAEGLFFVVMEHVAGGSLGGWAAGKPSPRWAAGVIRDVARTVAHFHAQGLVHLDLTPANILVDESTGRPVPKVVDFGLARTIAEEPGGVTRDGVRGTPPYMAPEQTTGDGSAVGPAADVYALGATLYHLLAGRPPFLGGGDLDTMAAIRDRPPEPPGRVAPGVPADLEMIALKCLEKDAGRRYPSADALADDLGRWLDGRPIRARPASRLRRAWLLARRRRRTVAACVAMALGLATGLGVRAEFRRLSDRQAAEAGRDLESLMRLAEGELNGPFPVRSGRLAPTVGLIHGLVGRLGPGRLSGPTVLRLSEIDGRTTKHLGIEGRADEAASVARERLVLLRAHGEALAGEGWRCRITAGALLDAAEAERLRGDAASALDFLDRARAAAIQAAESVDAYRSLALPLCHEYALLQAALERGGEAELAARAAAGLKAARDIAVGPSDRFDAVLLRACILAEAGRWQEAEGLARGLLAAAPPRPDSPMLQQAEQEATAGWIRAEVRSWLARVECGDIRPSEGGAELDGILAMLRGLATRSGLTADRLADVVCDEMAGQGVKRRQRGRIDEAGRVAAAFQAWAKALVRDLPTSAAARFALAESYSQESKNARRLDHDLHGRRLLETAVRVIHEAIDLDPGHERYWSTLKGWTARLAALPKS